MDVLRENVIHPLRLFAKDSIRFLRKSNKPDFHEFFIVVKRVSFGFAIMGGIGCFVKLVFIPINFLLL